MSTIQPGDIINKAHHHVMTYLSQSGTTPNRVFQTIESYGKDTQFEPDDDNQARQRPRTEEYLNTPCTCEHHWHGEDICTVNPPPQYYRGRSLDPE